MAEPSDKSAETASRIRDNISQPVTLLCESCGYRLDGLPETGNCPECGTPVVESTFASTRRLPAWEQRTSAVSFILTSAASLFRPTRFYRTLKTRVDRQSHRRSAVFATIHMALAAAVGGLSIVVHGRAVRTPWGGMIFFDSSLFRGFGGAVLEWVLLSTLTFIAFWAVKLLAERLTTWEAGWRGLRLPREVVRRGMDYHVVHVLPVVSLTLLLSVAFHAWILLDMPGGGGTLLPQIFSGYILALAGICVIGAIYLFWTYWIGMRNMLNANV